MGHCRTVGDIWETFHHEQGIGLEWEIPEFFLLPDSSDCIFYSPDFYYSGASWYLIIYPNGQAYCASQGWIVVFLCRRLCSPQKAVRFDLGIRRADETKEDMLTDLRLPEGCTHLRVNEFLLRSDLLKRRCELAPSNSLTITCAMYRDESLCVPNNILTYNDKQKPTSVQFQFNEQMNKNTRTDNILACSDEQNPTKVQFKSNELIDTKARAGNNLMCSDDEKSTSVRFKFNEEMDKNARADEHNAAQEVVIKDVLGSTSGNKAKSCDKDKGVLNMQRSVKQAMKCVLKFFGSCVGRCC